MLMITSVLVERQNIAATRVITRDGGPLAQGAIRLKVENFSITANNVTYAAIGDMHGYWGFFPESDVEGIVPVWGHAVVEQSNRPDIAVGERLYGYLPMASHVDLLVGEVTHNQVTEISPHRQPMSPFYNQYSRLAADPAHHPDHEATRNLFDPLFRTSFLIEAMFNQAEWHGAQQLLMTSASSKTAMALAHVARDKSPQIKRIGLTSAGNVDFVTATALYDSVIAYEDIGTIKRARSVCVDFAGNGNVMAAVRRHLADDLAYNCLVGATHVSALAAPPATDLPGPEAILFFAPDHATAVMNEIGAAAFSDRVASSWDSFVTYAREQVKFEELGSLEAAAQVFVATVQGITRPDTGMIVRL
jgi:hypothetical protein